MKLLLIGCLLCSVLLPPGTAHARTWYIKSDGTGDAPTIQAGIDSAAVGDSVILACGIYSSRTEQVIGLGMKSGIYLASETGSPDCVTISAHGMGTVLSGGQLNQSTTIKGLTIAGGDWVGIIADQASVNGNFSLDPLFCDKAGGNYTLKQCSPCAPGNHPQGWECMLIGALPVGCAGTAVTPTTWGRIKSMFR